MKIALIGNWKSRCGISTYVENLWPAVVKEGSYNARLFVTREPEPTSNELTFGDQELPPENLHRCWKPLGSVSEMVTQVRDFNPDLIWVQHNHSLWAPDQWAYFMLEMRGAPVVATFHSTGMGAEAENYLHNLIVHGEESRTRLHRLGYHEAVHVIPHGCQDYSPSEPVENRRVLQFGFGFDHKGWVTSVEALASIRELYPDAHLTLLMSETKQYPKEHHLCYNRVLSTIRLHGLEKQVTIQRGFLPESVIDQHLRQSQVVLLPYVEDQGYCKKFVGASGAARFAMSRGIPVITSRVHHFQDLPTVKASGVDQTAATLHRFFMGRIEAKKQVNLQATYVQENSFSRVAKKHVDLFNVLV